MSENKKIAKNSLLLYIRLIITSIVGLLCTRIIIKVLGVADYGLYNVVAVMIVMMGFLNTVMISTTFRFIAFEMGKKKPKAINKVFNISLTIHTIIAFFLLIFGEVIGAWYIENYLNVTPEQLDDAFFIFRFSLIGLFFNILSIPFQGLVVALEKFSVQVTIEVIRSLFYLLFVISLSFFFSDKLRLFAVLMMVLAIIPSLLYVSYIKVNYKKITKWRFEKDRRKYLEMMSFSGWTMFGAAASIGQKQGAALMINSFFGTILNASFGVANQLNSFIVMFAQNLGQAAVPQITKNHSNGNSNRVLYLVTYLSKYSFFLMLFPALPILLETEYFLQLWLGEIPRYAVLFAQLMILNGLFDALRSGIPAAIHATGKIKWFQIIMSVILISALPITYLLFNTNFEPYYIFIIYIFASIVTTIVSIFLLKKIINFDIKFLITKSYLRIFFVVLTLVPLFILINFFPKSDVRFFLSIFLSFIYTAVVVFFVGLDKREKNTLIQFFKKILLKIS